MYPNSQDFWELNKSADNMYEAVKVTHYLDFNHSIIEFNNMEVVVDQC